MPSYSNFLLLAVEEQLHLFLRELGQLLVVVKEAAGG
jgi:hypothetical protein